MLANILPLQLQTLTPGMGSKGPGVGRDKRSFFFFFSESSHGAYQINGNEAENTMQANILLCFIHMAPGWGQTFFSEVVHAAYQIQRKEVYSTFNASKLLNLMHSLDLFGWVKGHILNFLIELSELMCFGYDLNDTKMYFTNKSIGEMVNLVRNAFCI